MLVVLTPASLALLSDAVFSLTVSNKACSSGLNASERAEMDAAVITGAAVRGSGTRRGGSTHFLAQEGVCTACCRGKKIPACDNGFEPRLQRSVGKKNPETHAALYT